MLPPEPSRRKEEDLARIAAAQDAIKAIERVLGELCQGRDDAGSYAEAAAHVVGLYRQRIDGGAKTENEAEMLRKMDRSSDLRLAGIGAELETFYRLSRSHHISHAMSRKLVRELDLLEARFTPT
ncbi:hypothetical protein [Agrobacterium vitis]|uniref:hypothetical protein n=1 Tax=Agrobacterium vitis TaxID=373 RepID=UPI0020336CDC|nr:hypothetical protein [Agrobacterium vitis]MCM2449061.1 hypothetical protein [Agrobacterium vitis]